MTKKISVLFLIILLSFMLVPAVPAFASGVDVDNPDDFGIRYDNGKLEYGGAYGKDKKQSDVWNKIFVEYKGIIMGITGLGTLTMVALFIINFIKLGQAANNPSEKSRALSGLLWTGIAAAGLGGVTIFVGLAQGLLKS